MRGAALCRSIGLLGALVSVARADAPPTPGRVLFESYCVICHAAGGSPGSALDLASETVAQRSESELMDRIQRGVPGTEMPPFGLVLTPREVGQLVAYLRSMQGLPYVEPPALRSARQDEAYPRGRRLYFGRARCGECHKNGFEGGLEGPDLTGLGDRMSRQEIAEEIFRPSARITPGYETWVVETRGGRTLRGRMRKETERTLQLLDESGELWTTWRKEDLRSIERESRSTMPEGLVDPLSPAELRDLLHFLSVDRPGGR
jgi:putative heme-binding domain-containing protein